MPDVDVGLIHDRAGFARCRPWWWGWTCGGAADVWTVALRICRWLPSPFGTFPKRRYGDMGDAASPISPLSPFPKHSWISRERIYAGGKKTNEVLAGILVGNISEVSREIDPAMFR
jgi:hypothetical protein